MSDDISVALVEDDDAVRDSLSNLLARRGMRVSSFGSGQALISALDSGSSYDCVVSDIRMPRMSGSTLHRLMTSKGITTPIVFITGHGDIDLAVSSIKAGAADFIEKPINGERLTASIRSAVKLSRGVAAQGKDRTDLLKRYEMLSERQREVMLLAAQGKSNKEIAAVLGISPRTVEHYREWVMERMAAQNLAELVQMAVKLDLLNMRQD
jgi:two-component system response regulator FixJ